MVDRPVLNISRRRLWLFRILTPIAALLLVGGGLELALRLCGYGYPVSFFLKTKIEGRDYYVPNDRFGYRFFPPALARTPVPMRMEVQKPANTYRIFVFGESAALGDPDPTFGAWRYLQVLLNERFPSTHFQVVCVAMTAINSHVILPIARECAQRDGDLWIIYMGNNEMVGPFGAATVFGSRMAGIDLIRASIALKSTRDGQLLDSVVRGLNRASGPQMWSGLNMFKENQLPYNDPKRLRAYENFKQNLDDILRAGQGAGVPIILSTVGSNLKDCAPFGSLHSAGLKNIQQDEWDGIYAQGISLESNGNYPAALKEYEQAAAIDPHYADLHFRMGRCQLALTNFNQALSEFKMARDNDTLAFRADGRINQIIEDAANTNASRGVYFLDAFKVLAQNSPAAIPGNELFYEHVHLNFDGNYLLGLAFAEQAMKLLPKSILAHGKSEWASSELCDQRLAVTPWDRYRVWQDSYNRVSEPPFTDQLNNAQRAEFYQAKLQELKSEITVQSRVQARAEYQTALALNPDDYCLRENHAQFLDESGDLADAPAEEQKVSELLPQNPVTPCIIGRLLVRLGDIDGAEKNFLRSLAIQKNYAPAMVEMGMLLANQQKTAEAVRYFSRALSIDPGSVEAYQDWGFMEQINGNWNEALAHYRAAADHQPNGPVDYLYQAVSASTKGQGNEALESFNTAVHMNPNFWQARYLFGSQLASAGRTDEAQEQFAAVIHTRPDFAPGYLDNGLALVKLGKTDEALKQFQTTLQLDPANVTARQNLETIQASLKAPK